MMNPETQNNIKEITQAARNNSLLRIVRYTAMRLVTLFITVMVGIFLTIMIANMGGYVDNIMRAQVREKVINSYQNNKSFQMMGTGDRKALIDAQCSQEENRLGLNTPFVIRS
jgi:peptide/nickel transport system permease protein